MMVLYEKDRVDWAVIRTVFPPVLAVLDHSPGGDKMLHWYWGLWGYRALNGP